MSSAAVGRGSVSFRWKPSHRPRSTTTYGKFIVRPLERGFGTTIGNSLRRILLSSLQGAAITSVRIEGVLHEFSFIPGIVEDVTDIILNIKQLRIRHPGTAPIHCLVQKNGKVLFLGGGKDRQCQASGLVDDDRICTRGNCFKQG